MTRREPSTTGLDAHVVAALAYLAGPLSGILVLLAERTSSYVRFHAWQSVLALGGLGILVAGVMGLAFLSLLASAAAFRALLFVSWVLWGAWLVCWALCLIKAYRRRRWKLPIAGAYAERLSGRRSPASSSPD